MEGPNQLRAAIFFFQAEDGIRDHWVTGVQTCALPIEAGPASFGSGAGVGSGMVSALAAEVSATMPNAAPTNSPRPMPAMVPSPASPPVGSSPVWLEDDAFWQKALNSGSRDSQ